MLKYIRENIYIFVVSCHKTHATLQPFSEWLVLYMYVKKKQKNKKTLVRSHDRLVQLQVAASTFGTVTMETAALPACLPVWVQGPELGLHHKAAWL